MSKLTKRERLDKLEDEIRDLLAEDSRAEWNDGLPPAGVECESEPMEDNCPAARIGELGNQAHNLGCEYQNDEELSGELGKFASALWDLAKKAPIRTQAQREREEVVDFAARAYLSRRLESDPKLSGEQARKIAGALYDAGVLRMAGE